MKEEEKKAREENRWFWLSSVPVQVLAVLHVEEHGGDQLVHVLRLPDDGLQLVVHRLPHNALQAFDPRHPDPEQETEALKDGTSAKNKNHEYPL